mmetsp:Transcript_52424/g.59931  ORF Transcript_52424/g.59931 Transcript_52424/m.59931 type:complete len:85 (-) Transcript_52424:849-1103(-)
MMKSKGKNQKSENRKAIENISKRLGIEMRQFDEAAGRFRTKKVDEKCIINKTHREKGERVEEANILSDPQGPRTSLDVSIFLSR